jgi:hypothetical protein
MQNKTLAITKNCIPYFKELRTLAGSVTASILMQQLDYWFSKNEGKPFYKFKAPCNNQYYKNCDSFTEELGFSIEEFTNAFAKIGTVYKSKTEFDNESDKFKGMFYCSYFDRKEGLTFYYRNNALLDKKLNDLFTVNAESPFIENDKVDLHKTAKPISPIYITENTNNRLHTDTKEKIYKKENSIVKTNDTDLTDIIETIKEYDKSIILQQPKLKMQLDKVLSDLKFTSIDINSIFQDKLTQALFLLCLRYKTTRTARAIEQDLRVLAQVPQDKLKDVVELWSWKPTWQSLKLKYVKDLITTKHSYQRQKSEYEMDQENYMKFKNKNKEEYYRVVNNDISLLDK